MSDRLFCKVFLLGIVGFAIAFMSAFGQTSPDEVAATVERFARVGSAGSPPFHPTASG